MFSSHFLTSYSFFTSAVTAFRSNLEGLRDNPDPKAVAEAFKKATSGMPKEEQTMLTQFVLRLIQLPEEYEGDRDRRYLLQGFLDHEAVKALSASASSNQILVASDFMTHTGMTRDTLNRKLREHRIFKIPEWAHRDHGKDYYPGFFADTKYELSSLEAVSMALRPFSGQRKYRFFITPNTLLENKTPLEALADGKSELVTLAAKVFRKNVVTALETPANNTSPSARRIFNRIAVLISALEATHTQGVPDDAITELLKDCENSSYLDIGAANSLFSRIANALEELESRLIAKHQIKRWPQKEPWRRIPYSALDKNDMLTMPKTDQ